MSTKTQRQMSVTSLILLAVAFIVAISISNQLFSGWRIDLTENNLYTLADGTERMLDKIDEPVTLNFYYSDEATRGLPSLRSYAERVREMLEEFESNANGNIRLNVIDPLPFSEEEDRATQFGLQGVQPAGVPDPIYLGLAGSNSVGDEEVIPFFQPDKESFLEYDIAKLVSRLANPERSVIGVVSGVDMGGRFDPQTQRMQPPWMMYQQAQQLFELRDLGTSFDQVDDDVKLLWIIQPKDLDNDTLYAIDQFVVAGGNALIFVDPIADVDPVQTEGMPQGMPPMGLGSDLPQLFSAWGLEFDSNEVVADAELALQVSGMDRRPVRHYGFLGINNEHMSADDIVTADLNVVNIASAGSIGKSEESEFEFGVLLESSPSSQLMPKTRFSFLPDPSSLQDNFSASGKPQVIAARITGVVNSAFPDGPPNAADDAADAATHLSTGESPANLIVVADVDMLGDQLWVQVQNFFGQQIANTFASNGAFVLNALENLAGNSDLIGVRSRASFTRPFTRVEALRAEAESRFKQTEQRLQTELADTETRLAELQTNREDTGNILLTPEQQQEIDQFIDQRAAIRTELRAVQRGLDEDIDRLGTRLKLINIGLVPLLLVSFVIVAVWRRNRSRAI